MELRQLKYFVTVARTLNFSQAARQLYITQGTLSQQIKQLEDEMGAQLFERDSRNVSLTETGEEMPPLAQDALNAASLCRNRKELSPDLCICFHKNAQSYRIKATEEWIKERKLKQKSEK